MKFDFWTLLFQIINFAVLLFILKGVLYKPIKEIIEKRKSIIEKNISEAQKIKEEAMEIHAANQQEMEKLKELKRELTDKMKEEVEAERGVILANAEKEVQKLIEKKQVLFDTERRRLETELKSQSLEIVETLCTRLLQDISNEDLHRALFTRFKAEIPRITEDIKNAYVDNEIKIELLSAYPISEADIKEIENEFATRLNKKASFKAVLDDNLIAGLRIRAIDKVYDTSLKGQIQTFRDRLRDEG
ncbi:MAG: F0F1 ATP synthase subunit delta [Thermodesulfovibrionales bacterium]